MAGVLGDHGLIDSSARTHSFALLVLDVSLTPHLCLFCQGGTQGGVQQLGHGGSGWEMVGGKSIRPLPVWLFPYMLHKQGISSNANQICFCFCFFPFVIQGVDLQKLILAHNNLEVLREDLRNLSSLVVLNISHNNISSLPAAIGEYVLDYPYLLLPPVMETYRLWTCLKSLPSKPVS